MRRERDKLFSKFHRPTLVGSLHQDYIGYLVLALCVHPLIFQLIWQKLHFDKNVSNSA